LEQLLNNAVQGQRLTVKINVEVRLRKRRPSSPSPPSRRNPDYAEIPSQPSEQDYRDAHSRVLAARGVALTPVLEIKQQYAVYN
jgi:hypothetical protein